MSVYVNASMVIMIMPCDMHVHVLLLMTVCDNRSVILTSRVAIISGYICLIYPLVHFLFPARSCPLFYLEISICATLVIGL